MGDAPLISESFARDMTDKAHSIAGNIHSSHRAEVFLGDKDGISSADFNEGGLTVSRQHIEQGKQPPAESTRGKRAVDWMLRRRDTVGVKRRGACLGLGSVQRGAMKVYRTRP